MDMIWEFINPSNDYLSAIIGMIMSIIALALPISQNTISDRLAAYHNKHVLEMFKVERTYKAMHCSILLLIFTLVFSILFNESLFWGKLVGLLCLFAGIASVIIFWLYFRRTNQYAINTDSVVFDFAKLDYISSAGLRVLLSANKEMLKKGKKPVKIINANEIVKEVFDVTGFSDILDIA